MSSIALSASGEYSCPSRPTRPARALIELGLLVLIQWQATSALIDFAVKHLPHSWTRPGWPYGYVGHIIQMLVAFALMTILKPFFSGNFGLRWPTATTYVRSAIAFGIITGLLMLLLDYWPNLRNHQPPPGPYMTNMGNVVPWLLMQGVLVGITEETVFRSLFLGYLKERLPGTVRIKQVEVSWAVIVTAEIFALAHASSFLYDPLATAIAQQVYIFAFGLFYGYLFERSKSVLAPVLFHNAGDFVEWVCCFLLRAVWSH